MFHPAVIAIVAAVAVLFAVLKLRRPRPKTASTPGKENPFLDRLDVAELARRLNLSAEALQTHVSEYRVAELSKPRGGKRRLEIPDAKTMDLQRRILRRVLDRLSAHLFACGFEPETSIVDAALPHEGKAVVVKLDIRRFFESTTAARVRAYFQGIGWTQDAAELLTRLTTHEEHLPQGAPTSPRLSNLVNAPLDEGLLKLAEKHRGSYSRYADDITLSFHRKSGRRVRGIIQAARRILRSYGYAMHGGRKLRILRQHQQQQVLGLVVNSRVALPRARRRWLRAVRHRIDQGKPATLTPEQLQGWEALAKMVEEQRSE